MGMTTKSQVKQPRTISTIFQEGLNIRIFDMMVKRHDDLHWFHHNFKMVNLLPVFVFNFNFMPKNKINSQSLEDTQVGYISYKYTLERAFKPSYISFQHLSLHTHFQAFKPSQTILSILAFIHILEHLSLHTHFLEAFMPLYTPRFLCAFHFNRLYIFAEHCCHHTFLSIAASIQPNPRSIQASIHP